MKAIELRVKGQTARVVKFLVSGKDVRKDVVDSKDALETLAVLEKYDVIFRYLTSEYDVIFRYLTSEYTKDGTWNTYCLVGKDENIDTVIKDYNNWS